MLIFGMENGGQILSLSVLIVLLWEIHTTTRGKIEFFFLFDKYLLRFDIVILDEICGEDYF